jgi:hypothetical protein
MFLANGRRQQTTRRRVRVHRLPAGEPKMTRFSPKFASSSTNATGTELFVLKISDVLVRQIRNLHRELGPLGH